MATRKRVLTPRGTSRRPPDDDPVHAEPDTVAEGATASRPGSQYGRYRRSSADEIPAYQVGRTPSSRSTYSPDPEPAPVSATDVRPAEPREVGDVITRIFRHWILLFLVLLVAAGAAAAVFRQSKPSYESTSSVLLVPPTTTSNPNPLLGLDNNLSQLAVVLGAALESNASRVELARQGATADFTVQSIANPSPNLAQLSARLEFTTTAQNRALAVKTANSLITAARAQLVQLQDQTGIATESQVGVLRLSGASPPQAVGNSRLRATGIAGAGVVLVGCLAIVVVDSAQAGRYRRRRRVHRVSRRDRRRQRRAAESEATTDAPEASPPDVTHPAASRRRSDGDGPETDEAADTTAPAPARPRKKTNGRNRSAPPPPGAARDEAGVAAPAGRAQGSLRSR